MEHQRFNISTLRDIYNLPTLEQVQACLFDMSESIIKAREVNDRIGDKLVAEGFPRNRILDFPEVSVWIDDGEHNNEPELKHLVAELDEIITKRKDAGSTNREGGDGR